MGYDNSEKFKRSMSIKSIGAVNSSTVYRRFFGNTSHASIMGGDSLASEDNHHAKLGEYAVCMWKENIMTDVKVVVGEREFSSHKAVLACYSPYFKEVLLKPGANEVHYLEIPCVTPDAFEILLKYMYTGELHVTCQELADVYRAARKLGMKDAVTKCLEMLTVSAKSIENAIYLYVTARKLDLLEPSVRAFRLMVAHFETLIGSKEFLDLEIDQVVDFFSADEIGARSEIIVYLAALYWLEHNFLDRERYIHKLMSCVRFSMMSIDEILMCYHPPLLPGIVKYPCVKESLYGSTCYVTARSRGQEDYFSELSCKTRRYLLTGQPPIKWDFQSLYHPELYPQYRDRKAAITIQAAVRGFLARKVVGNALSNRHLAATAIQAAFKGFMVRKLLRVQRQEQIREVANYPTNAYPANWDLPSNEIATQQDPSQGQQQQYRNSVNVYPAQYDSSLSQRQYSNLSDNRDTSDTSVSPGASDTSCYVCKPIGPRYDQMSNNEISQLSRESFENVIYILGAFNPARIKVAPSNILMSYSRSAKAWRELDYLPEPRQNVQMAALGEFLYCIGGCEVRLIDGGMKTIPRKECFRYHTGQRAWIPMAPMKVGRMFHGVTTLNGYIYAIGGKDHNSRTMATIECYDTNRDTWSDAPPMMIRRMGMGTTALDGIIWIVGGFTGEDNQLALVDSVECLDIGQNRTIVGPRLPRPIAYAPLINCQGKLYLVGGAHQPRDDQAILTSLSTVLTYDCMARGWKIITDLPRPLHSVIASTLGADIYILGGFSNQEQRALDEVIFYDTIERRWRTCCPLPPSVGGYVLAAVERECM